MREGGCEGYFSMAEQFHTQDEPAYCGLGSLSMVLNALNIEDTDSVVKHNAKHLTETNLDIHKPLSVVQRTGITFDEFECMAVLNGASVVAKRADAHSKAEFLEDILKVATTGTRTYMVLTYSRASLGQTGDGHFSPLGAFLPSKQLCLILDTARFKYPPYWLELDNLYDSMMPHDSDTGRARGWFLLSRHHTPSVSQVARSTIPWGAAKQMVLDTVPSALRVDHVVTPYSVVLCVLKTVAEDMELLGALRGADPEGYDDLRAWEEVCEAVRMGDVYGHVLRAFEEEPGLKGCWGDEVRAALVIAAWPVQGSSVPPGVQTTLATLQKEPVQRILRNEVSAIEERLLVMSGQRCTCEIASA